MAGSVKSGSGKAAIKTNGENQGVKGSSGTPSGQGINRKNFQPTTTELRTLQNVKFEAERKGVKGSSNTPSSDAAQRANIAKGGLR